MGARLAEIERPLLPDQVAARWQCSTNHVRALIKRGELRAFRLGGKLLRIPVDAVEDYERCQNIVSAGSKTDGSSHGGQTASAIDTALMRRLARRPSEV